MVNIKYYFVLVITVFLTLGVGIFIGFNMGGSDMMDKSRAALTEQIEMQFSQLREENKTLVDQLAQLNKEKGLYEVVNKWMYQEIIKEKLADMRIAIIQNGDSYDYSSMVNALEMAGADIAGWYIVYLPNDDTIRELSGYGIDASNIKQSLPEQIASIMQSGTEKTPCELFMSTGCLKAVLAIKEIPDFIIIAGGGVQQSLDIELIRAIKSIGIPLVAVEQESIKDSNILAYKKEGISTVDNVDSSIGQLSLIAVIRGAKGHFGVKSSAESMMPQNMNESI